MPAVHLRIKFSLSLSVHTGRERIDDMAIAWQAGTDTQVESVTLWKPQTLPVKDSILIPYYGIVNQDLLIRLAANFKVT